MRFFKPNTAILLTFVIMVISVMTKGQDSKQDTIRAVVVSTIKADTNSFQKDTTRARVSYNKTDSTSFQNDTIKDHHNDVSALDIGSDRGIYILSADRILQLRIVGSVRGMFNYSDQLLSNKQGLNPYEIPTDIHTKSPNYYAGIKQTRLGFEVNHHTKTKGDIFIRIEADFNNIYNSFRVRHAYGQIGWLLVGQTWSLMNNVSYQPAMVSKNGSPGGNSMRTPQLRYSNTINKNMGWSLAIEYSSTNINIPDSITGTLLQVFPDITGRYTYSTDVLSFRFAAVISTTSGRIDSNTLNYSLGFGGSFSARIKTKEKGHFYMSVTSGRAVSRFMDLFHGKNEDMIYNPTTEKFDALVSIGGYMAYSHSLPKDFSASISFGMASINNREFQLDDAYSYGYNALLNVFWKPLVGARVGLEYAYGQRFDKGGNKGNVNRVSVLLYYDF